MGSAQLSSMDFATPFDSRAQGWSSLIEGFLENITRRCSKLFAARSQGITTKRRDVLRSRGLSTNLTPRIGTFILPTRQQPSLLLSGSSSESIAVTPSWLILTVLLDFC